MVNLRKAKKDLQRVIDTAPTIVTYNRVIYEPDGHGGKIKKGVVEVGKFKGLLDNANARNSGITFIANDAGNIRENNSNVLYVLFGDDIDEHEFQPEINDFFDLNGVQYRFTDCINVLNLDLLWHIPLEINEVKVNGAR